MENQFLENLKLITKILEQIAKIFWFVIPIIAAVWYFFYMLGIRKKVSGIETKIFKVKKDIDEMMNTVHKRTAGTINQSQLKAITERDRIPLRAELEKLSMERQYLLDKISILGLLKKP